MSPEKVVVPDKTEPGDHDLFSHYVKKELLADAIIFGKPLKALCGKMWIPSRDHSKFPVCPACKDAYDNLPED
jgi:hypothetical protein